MKKPDSIKLDPHSEKCKDYFEEQYSKEETYWGDQPNLIVPLISSHLRPGSRVLVVGCGEGRDAIFLARLGFDVVATEISFNGLDRALKISLESGQKLEFFQLDAHQPHDHFGKFNAILMMNILQFLNPDLVIDRIRHFQTVVENEGLFCAQLFTVEDPMFKQAEDNNQVLDDQLVVEHPERKYRVRFFEKGELASYFKNWEMIYYHEGRIWDKPHGTQTEIHQHGLAQMIARKIA